MFSNYMKIAWRVFSKNKVFSLINIIGLSTGLVSCMLISIYLWHELSYDRYHKNVKDLYLVGTVFSKDGKEEKTPNTPAPMALAMQREFPEIVSTARTMPLFGDDKTLFQWKQPNGELKSLYETKGYLADPNFFKLFSYHFIEGNASTSLAEPNSIVLSEEMAEQLFGKEAALGKVIHINSSTNGEGDFKVTGVFRPMATPTQIDARFFASIPGGQMEQFIKQQTDMVGNNMFATYLLLHNGADAKRLEAKFPAFVDKYMGIGLKAAGFYKKQFLIPVKGLHLYSGLSNDVNAGSTASATYLYILGSIALFILLIACINFMNLSTARSSKRSAEVGVRKVLGAQKKSLIWQFIGESVFMSILAFVIALLVTMWLLPYFARISGKNLDAIFAGNWTIIGGFFILAIVAGLLGGSYPAFYLSSFQPVKVLKGKLSNSLSVVALRKGLVVFQFVISVVLIIAAIVIASQMNYLRNTDLGFAKDQQIVIPLRTTAAKNVYSALKNAILSLPQVENAGAALYYPGIVNPSDMMLYRQGETPENGQDVHTNWVDESLLQTLEIKPVAGRIFSKDFPSDTANKMILNEKAARELGYKTPAEALNGQIKMDWRGQTYSWTIIGVVKDFHFQDLHVEIAPYGFQLNNQPNYNYLIVHARSREIPGLLAALESSWRRLDPGEPFEYSFLDKDFEKNYSSEERLQAMVQYFTIVAILISCLGLFGLATFSAEQRIKEIGIRKTLGASIARIYVLLSQDFLKLTGIALVIAMPLSWWLMNKWLLGFPYRTPITWQVFLNTVIAVLVISLATISFQAIRAAISNPVKSLRTE